MKRRCERELPFWDRRSDIRKSAYVSERIWKEQANGCERNELSKSNLKQATALCRTGADLWKSFHSNVLRLCLAHLGWSIINRGYLAGSFTQLHWALR